MEAVVLTEVVMPPTHPRSPIQHRNEVLLVGRVAEDPSTVSLPSGDSVVTIRLVVQRLHPQRTPPRARVDTLNCAAWGSELRRVVSEWEAGDTVEVSGALRRRFWRSATGPASRYEVELVAGRRLARGSAERESGAPPEIGYGDQTGPGSGNEDGTGPGSGNEDGTGPGSGNEDEIGRRSSATGSGGAGLDKS